MIRHFFKIAWRNAMRHKGYFILNVLGLSIGFASALLIFIHVRHELSYDGFYNHKDRICRVVETNRVGGALNTNSSIHYPPGAFIEKLPRVESLTRLVRFGFVGQDPVLAYGDKRFYESKFFFGDSNIFKVLEFQLQEGDERTALRDPNTLVISSGMALRYFGDAPAVGKVLKFNGSRDVRVTGVLAPLRGPSHIDLDCIASLSTLPGSGFAPAVATAADMQGNWYNDPYYTYVLLKPDADVNGFRQDLDRISKENYPDFHKKNETALQFQRIYDIHLRSNYDGDITPPGDILYVWVFVTIGILILFVAAINYVNLATARSAVRARESGLRKVVGAPRHYLIGQHLTESVLQSFLAGAAGFLIADEVRPYFNLFARTNYHQELYSFDVLVLAVLLSAVVGILAGIYPALLYSGLDPVQILKGTFRTSARGIRLRKILVVSQFFISIALVTATLIVREQLQFIQDQNLGFARASIVVVPVRGTAVRKQWGAFKESLLGISGVRFVSGATDKIGAGVSFSGFFVEGQPDMQFLTQVRITWDFVKTMDMHIAEGRDLSKDYPSDSISSYLVNQAFVRQYGWTSAIGKQIRFFRDGTPQAQIVGVIEDFHSQSLHAPVGPVVLYTGPISFAYIKIENLAMAQTLTKIENTWNQFEPERPFAYSFLDEAIGEAYASEEKLSFLMITFAGLAIFVASLGLLGLASFTMDQRTKEIAIRKTVGATFGNIAVLMYKEYFIQTALACALAWPLTAWALQKWLENFAYRVSLTAGPFLWAGLMALAIAMVTVSWHVRKAANTLPAQALKFE